MRIPPSGSPISSSIVDRIVEAQSAPVEASKSRRQKTQVERNEFNSLSNLLSELGTTASSIANPMDFTQLKVESSHPDIIDGAISGTAMPGSYEFEVRSLAQTDRHVDIGMPDRNKTPVGFGYMSIDLGEAHGNKSQEVVIHPGSTLDEVAQQINDQVPDVRASVIPTNISEEPYRLMVASTETGKNARINIDPDTTFLDFENIRKGRDLDMSIDDVAINRSGNQLSDLLDGVSLDVKRSEPGTRVQVNVGHDIDRTMESIKAFTGKYNQVIDFANRQYEVSPETGRRGDLAGDGNLRSTVRALQAQVSSPQTASSSFANLAAIGISTNAKTGALNIDEKKLKEALTKDYDSVAKLFTNSPENGKGLAARLGDAVKSLKDPMHGAIPSRLRSLDKIIKSQDDAITRQTERMEQKRSQLYRQFDALQGKVANIESQGLFLGGLSGQAATQPSLATTTQEPTGKGDAIYDRSSPSKP